MHQSIKIILNILKYSPEYIKENIKIFSRPWWVALKRGLGRGMLLRPSKLDLVLYKFFHFATLFKTRDQSVTDSFPFTYRITAVELPSSSYLLLVADTLIKRPVVKVLK